MNLSKPLSAFMSRNFHSVSSDVSIGKAEKIMLKKQVELLAVEENHQLVGIVSRDDCTYFKTAIDGAKLDGPEETLILKHHSVSEIMNTKLVRLGPDDSCKLASDIMKSIIFQVIPVVDNKKLVGILTPQDIQNCSKPLTASLVY